MGNAVISSILFQPPSPANLLTYRGRQSGYPEVNYLWLFTSSGTIIPAVHILCCGSNNGSGSRDNGRYTMLYSHGNAEDLGLITHFLSDLARLLQVNILCYDYSGYGMSTHPVYVGCLLRDHGDQIARWRELPGPKPLALPMTHPVLRCEQNMDQDPDQGAHSGAHSGAELNTNSRSRTVDEFDFEEGEEDYDFTTSLPSCTNYEEGEGGTIVTESSPESSPESVMTGMETVELDAHSSAHSHAHSEATSPAAGRLDARTRRKELFQKHQWSPPSPSEEQCYLDIQAAYQYLLQSVPPQRILLYGKSVGSGPTCWLAQKLCCLAGGISQVDAAMCNCSAAGPVLDMADHLNDREDNSLITHPYPNTAPNSQGAIQTQASLESCANSDNSSRRRHHIDERQDHNHFMSPDHTSSRDPAANNSANNPANNDTNNSTNNDSLPNVSPGGVILHSPFLSVIRVVLDVGFTTIGDLFPNVNRIPDISCPVYVIHGTEDQIVPFYHGQTIFSTLPDTSKSVPFWAVGAGHNNIEMEMPTAYVKRLQQFIKAIERRNSPNTISKVLKYIKSPFQQAANDLMNKIHKHPDQERDAAKATGRPIVSRRISQPDSTKSKHSSDHHPHYDNYNHHNSHHQNNHHNNHNSNYHVPNANSYQEMQINASSSRIRQMKSPTVSPLRGGHNAQLMNHSQNGYNHNFNDNNHNQNHAHHQNNTNHPNAMMLHMKKHDYRISPNDSMHSLSSMNSWQSITSKLSEEYRLSRQTNHSSYHSNTNPNATYSNTHYNAAHSDPSSSRPSRSISRSHSRTRSNSRSRSLTRSHSRSLTRSNSRSKSRSHSRSHSRSRRDGYQYPETKTESSPLSPPSSSNNNNVNTNNNSVKSAATPLTLKQRKQKGTLVMRANVHHSSCYEPNMNANLNHHNHHHNNHRNSRPVNVQRDCRDYYNEDQARFRNGYRE